MHAPPSGPRSDPATLRLVLAYAAVYFIWGSTYLAIRFSIETLPPFLMAGLRFLIAGGGLYAWVRARGVAAPKLRQWKDSAVVAAFMLLGANGSVVVAEQWVPSGLAALLVSVVPLWLVLLDWRWGSRARPSRRVMAGIAAGFAGVALLTGSPGVGAGGRQEWLGVALLVAAALSWAVGSLFSRYARQQPPARLWVAMQMWVGGAMFMVVSASTGELSSFDAGAVSLRSTLALAYLIVFGALVAYSAYIWLLSVSTPTRVGTYAFVNPVVALFLGWGMAGEPLTPRSLMASTVVVAAVVVITTGKTTAGDGRTTSQVGSGKASRDASGLAVTRGPR